MRQPETFWDKLAVKYSNSPIKNMEAYETTMERTRAHLKPEDNVLEVGCGTGTTALKLAPAVAHITASDFSSGMIEIGRGKAADQGVENVTFVQATLDDATLVEGSYDAVLAYNVLHLIEDLPAAVKRIHALLKPDGQFISKTPCMGGRFSIWPLVLPFLQMIGKAPHVGFLKTDDVDALISDSGFEIVEAENIPPIRPNHFVVARKV